MSATKGVMQLAARRAQLAKEIVDAHEFEQELVANDSRYQPKVIAQVLAVAGDPNTTSVLATAVLRYLGLADEVTVIRGGTNDNQAFESAMNLFTRTALAPPDWPERERIKQQKIGDYAGRAKEAFSHPDDSGG